MFLKQAVPLANDVHTIMDSLVTPNFFINHLKYLVKHGLGEFAGLGVLLARMV
jgi:hypothetical protein